MGNVACYLTQPPAFKLTFFFFSSMPIFHPLKYTSNTDESRQALESTGRAT